jgi:hypothetical protein
MTKPAEGGRFGAATLRSYTYWLVLAAWIGFVSYVRYDIGEGGPGLLRAATGLQSNTWVWVFVVAGWFAATIPNQRVSVLYTRYTGRLAYGDDRIGYAKSGGHDIANWGGFLTLIALLYVFAAWVPPGLGWLRPLVLLVATAVIGSTVSVFFAKKVFFALYGPPRYQFP